MNLGRNFQLSEITIPWGYFSTGYFWYERDPELFQGEKKAMARYFPHFRLGKLDNGKLSWIGVLSPTNIRPGSQWHIQVVYNHNHPNNSTFGGSIKIYSIKPDLAKLALELDEPIPHLLRDSAGHLYLCTARAEDVKVGQVNTTAASALAWATKWITYFELWIIGDLSTKQFREHI